MRDMGKLKSSNLNIFIYCYFKIVKRIDIPIKFVKFIKIKFVKIFVEPIVTIFFIVEKTNNVTFIIRTGNYALKRKNIINRKLNPM